MVSKTDALDEILEEQSWELHRRFMQEVERELGYYIPVETLISCQNVILKWIDYTRLN